MRFDPEATTVTRSAFGSIRQRTDTGRWQARWQDRTGRQHSRTFPTKRDAAAWLRDESTKLDEGSWVDRRAGRVTFEAFAERWSETLVDLRPSTLDRDRQYLRDYLVTRFGPVELAAIDHLAVRAWVASMASTHSPATVVKAAQIMGKVMRAAVTARLISASPCDGVKLPRVEREEMRFLDVEQVWRLHDAIDPRYRGVVLVGAFAGLRAGEMFGLRAGHVDPLHGRIEVRENAVEIGGRIEVGPPKTRAGRRTVPVPSFVAEALDLTRGPDALVFTAPHGGHVRRSSWRSRVWVPALARAGLPGLRIHDLRHTAVALWLAAGASPLEVARRAGHTSAAVVLDRYGHLLPAAEDTLTRRLEALGGRPPTNISSVR